MEAASKTPRSMHPQSGVFPRRFCSSVTRVPQDRVRPEALFLCQDDDLDSRPPPLQDADSCCNPDYSVPRGEGCGSLSAELPTFDPHSNTPRMLSRQDLCTSSNPVSQPMSRYQDWNARTPSMDSSFTGAGLPVGTSPTAPGEHMSSFPSATTTTIYGRGGATSSRRVRALSPTASSLAVATGVPPHPQQQDQRGPAVGHCIRRTQVPLAAMEVDDPLPSQAVSFQKSFLGSSSSTAVMVPVESSRRHPPAGQGSERRQVTDILRVGMMDCVTIRVLHDPSKKK